MKTTTPATRIAVAALLLSTALGIPASPAADEVSFVVIVAAANPASSIKRQELARLFLKKSSRWSNGGVVIPVEDLAFTLRIDINPHWLVKAEFHRFDGTYNLAAFENPKPLEKDWTLFAIKTTLHF